MFVLPTFNLGVVGSPTQSIEFPVIEVYDNESDFITSTNATQYTIVHAKDTDKLYVWDGSVWVLFDNN